MHPLTRRQFLRSATVAAGAVAFSPLVRPPLADAALPKCIWGAFPDPAPECESDADGCGPEDLMPAVRDFEAMVGRAIRMTRHYPRWDYPIPNPVIKESRRTGHIPLIAWKPQLLDHSWLSWADIAMGVHDARIDEVASGLAEWNRAAHFVFHHEPENAFHNGHGGTRDEFKRAYDHVRARFDLAGAWKIKHVSTLQRVTYDGKNGGPAAWFPDTAELLGVDGYNRALCGGDKLWHTFEDLFDSAHDFAASIGRDMVVQECGSVENDDVCGVPGVTDTKANWILEMGGTIKSWPQVKAVIYTHSLADFRGRPVDFRVNTSPETLSAYTHVGALAYFN
jgi:hypothetical protein